MFKKVSLMVVALLAVAPFANAGLALNPTDMTIGLGDSATVAITTNAEISSGVGEQYALLLADAAGLSITANAATLISEDCFAMNVTDAGVPVPAGTDGVYVGVFDFGAAYPAGSTIVDGLSVTGLVAGNYLATLYNVDLDGTTILGTAGTLNVTVTPEPATLALLGLGGLLLKRRKA
jgi:hypothetical protein